jgi:hypothetical protein
LYAVNSADGSIVWEHINATFSDPILHERSIYVGDVGANFTAGLFEVDIISGEATRVWQSSVGAPASPRALLVKNRPIGAEKAEGLSWTDGKQDGQSFLREAPRRQQKVLDSLLPAS